MDDVHKEFVWFGGRLGSPADSDRRNDPVIRGPKTEFVPEKFLGEGLGWEGPERGRELG